MSELRATAKNEKKRKKNKKRENTNLAFWDRVPAEPDPLFRVEERRLPEQALLFSFFLCR